MLPANFSLLFIQVERKVICPCADAYTFERAPPSVFRFEATNVERPRSAVQLKKCWRDLENGFCQFRSMTKTYGRGNPHAITPFVFSDPAR
jgi:hypothetical protein